MEFVIDRTLLPNNKVLRRELLDEYFSLDLIGFEEFQTDHWKLTTFTPDKSEYFIDPCLDNSLLNWFEPISIDKISEYKRFYKNCMISFVDSWSLYYWSLIGHFLGNLQTRRLNLVHIDDHKDHDTPLIYEKQDNYFSLLTDKPVSFSDPKSIESIIQEKAVSMGSFIAPLIHAVNTAAVIHLKYSHSKNIDDFCLQPYFIKDSLLRPGAPRPSLRLIKKDNKAERSSIKHSYTVSSNIDQLLDYADKDEICFLHVDCDAFNNRYNGSSSWTRSHPSIDLNLTQIRHEIEQLFHKVSQKFTKTYLNIAMSPGFFPSEYWKEILQFLLSRGVHYGIIQDDDFSLYLKNMCPEETTDGFNT